MSRLRRRFFPAAGLLVAVIASVLAVRAWRGEQMLAEGRAAQHRGHFDAATAAYRGASGYGNADAAIERARLELLRRDWDGALGSLREAGALAPTRGLTFVLLARLDLDGPGPRDEARKRRILDSCETAVAREPNGDGIRGECEGIAQSLAGRGRP